MRLSPQTPESIDALFGGMSVDGMGFSFDDALFDAAMLSTASVSGGCAAVRARRPEGDALAAVSGDWAGLSPLVEVWGAPLSADADEWIQWLRVRFTYPDVGNAVTGEVFAYLPGYVLEEMDAGMVTGYAVDTARNRRLSLPPDAIASSQGVEFLFWCWTWSRFDPVEAEWTVEPRMQQIDSWEVR